MDKKKEKTKEELFGEMSDLRLRLDEAVETLRAIGHGEVDALLVSGPSGEQVYTLQGVEHAYRVLVESMNEGAITLTERGTIIYCNEAFAGMTGTRYEKLVGTSFRDLVSEKDKERFDILLNAAINGPGTVEIELNFNGGGLAVYLSCSTRVQDEVLIVFAIVTDITERKKEHKKLKEAHDKLELRVKERTMELSNLNDELEEKVRERTSELYNANIALRVLLKQRDEDKNELEEKIISNVRKLIMPSIEELNKSGMSTKNRSYLGLLKSNLLSIISSFPIKLSKYANLTTKEILVADFIKRGQSTKEIAQILDVSNGTIDSHRNNIRKKLGLNNKKTNLMTYLSSIT